ncbi:HNH endonuclease signature motif containing protein [Aliarcobacter butzleri]|uniref:HNH endonuclease signature motif containing protein n=2 Tax=Aliarcobacter butzleri TaxID=28197 RepID=UPI003AF9E746
MRKAIPKFIERQLYVESMGKCMNPNCKTDLFLENGDIAEKAHIIPHCDTADNSFENLILLCPNCHTDFDKNAAFEEQEVKIWKSKRAEQFKQIFQQKYTSFTKLEKEVRPLLQENKSIYENYYMNENKKLWLRFEEKLLLNNEKLKLLLTANKDLIQEHYEENYSNLEVINQFLLHIEEFKETREDTEKLRAVLFPEEINSIFGLQPVNMGMIPSVKSLECLISKLKNSQNFIELSIGNDEPYIKYRENGEICILYFNDTPRVRQVYNDYYCFRQTKLRLESLNFALQYLNNNRISFEIQDFADLSRVEVKGKSLKFIYEYCLSKDELISLAPERNLILVNLHNWNGSSCISAEAYSQAEIMDVELLTTDCFFDFVKKIKYE